jgi:DNA phosphorothioation-associated putative methyltransferase
MALAQHDGIVSPDTSVFDYGCGRGGDVRRLQAAGIEVTGWDPAFAPHTPKQPADVVNLGYVVNVIERPDERAQALSEAWRLARRVLVVAGRLDWEARYLAGTAHSDGLVTARGPFQKLYLQEELRAWIDATLDVKSVAAAPGVFYVFRDDVDAQRYLAERVRSRAASPAPLISEHLYELHRPLFDELAAFIAQRGRLPRDEELPSAPQVRAQLGSIPRAFAILRRVTGADQWQRISDDRRRDVLVYLALANFGGRPSLSKLPPEMQYDVRDLFGSYKAATTQADRLLFAAGAPEIVDASSRAATVGKLTSEALYVHVSALPYLPPVLRVYEGCGRALTGTVEGANILKLHRRKPQVSYLEYPAFDRDAHPSLSTAVIARLGSLDVAFRDFRDSANPPILHRKESFVAADYPGRHRFARLTAQEERADLFAESHVIGTRDGWERVLQKNGRQLRGHRLFRTASRVPPPP